MNELRNCALVCFLLCVPQPAVALQNAWIATWAASPQSAGPSSKEPLLKIEDQTVRERVRVSIGGAETSISLYFPKRVATPTLHALALKRAVVSQRGDHTRAQKIEATAVSRSSILVSAVLVPAQPSQRLIVAFGDSLSDGDGSTIDADHNWPSDLIRRLGKTPEGSTGAVVN